MLDEKSLERPTSESNESGSGTDLAKLRSLLIGDDYENVLKSQIEQTEAERVSGVLAEAFHLRNSRDDSLSKELSPVIESAIDISIKDNPSRITNVIFPIMGPAVRKAVTSALADMMRSLNHLLQQSLTAQALVWRFKAWRLGVPYGQYVLLQTLEYRVEQVFFIHKETGLLIESASAAGIHYQDPDLVSSMLTAITDFVSDSFKSDGDSISTIQFSDLSIVIESGPHAVLAFAVRGILDSAISQELKQKLEVLHVEFSDKLATFNGDLSQFEGCKRLLEASLVEKSKQKKKSKPWLAIIAVSTLTLLIGYSSYLSWHKHQYLSDYVANLEKQIGIQVINSALIENEFEVTFLRSPLSNSIEALEESFSYPGITLRLFPKVALIESPEYFLAPIASKYGVTLDWTDTGAQPKLIVKGQLTQTQIDKLIQDPIVTSVFDDIDTNSVQVLLPVSEAQQSRNKFFSLVQKLNSTSLFFESASVTMSPDSQQKLTQIINDIREVLLLQQSSGLTVLQIGITGYADHQGTDVTNIKLSEERAKLVAEIMTTNEINSALIISWGVGDKGLENIDSANHRRVDLKIVFNDLPGGSN